jgi:DNA modification methylase
MMLLQQLDVCLVDGSRKYIGIELDAEYLNQASARLARVKERVAAKQLSAFAPTLRG